MIESAVAAIRAGKAVVIPTDTVYGLCASPYTEEPVRRLSRLKGRDERQPIALLASDVDFLLECVPELRGRFATIARAVLPGPYTLVFPNPARRFRWLTGSKPDSIGIRVPKLDGYGRDVLLRVGAVAATSANRHGDPDPRTVSEIPAEIVAGVGEVVDGGPVPGTPSTVIDFTGDEPVVLRQGAGDAAQALELAAQAR